MLEKNDENEYLNKIHILWEIINSRHSFFVSNSYNSSTPPTDSIEGNENKMNVEILAAAAVYLFSTYNHYLNIAFKQNRAMQRYRVLKKINETKQLEMKRRSLMLSVQRKRKRQDMNRQFVQLLGEPSGEFWSFVHMSSADFEYLLQKISPIIAKRNTRWRESIPAKIRLALTLRFLTTGDSYGNLSDMFKIATSIISRTIPEVCLAISDILSDMIKIPSNEEEWLALSEGFNFPHCLGALDGKHITISPSCYTGTEYVNYIGTFSIVLMTLIDSDCCFTFADVLSEGRTSDDDELNQSVLWQRIISNSLNLPNSSQLDGSSINLPYVFLGDETFPHHNCILKPFSGDPATGTPQRIFNQHVARSRAVIENTFGIMSSVFKVFKKPIPLDAEKSSIVTLTCILLHNFLRKSNTSRDIYSPPGSIDIYSHNELVSHGSWRNKSRSSFIPLRPATCTEDKPDECGSPIKVDFMKHLYTNLTRN